MHGGETCLDASGNAVMVAMQMDNEEQVRTFYHKPMALGASDEGAPGQHIDSFYADYFCDPDGDKLNAFCFNEMMV